MAVGVGGLPGAAPASLESGRIVEGFEVLELLGAGGVGAVYKALDLRTGRIVALKTLYPTRARLYEFEVRFEREAAILSRLDHPRIVRFLGFGREESLGFLVMEYVSGRTLRHRLEENRLSVPQAFSVFFELCDALEYLHSFGLVHRDVKPENVLLDEGGHVRLGDFGMVKLWDTERRTLTRSTSAFGTALYAAPEQIRNCREIDGRADVYSAAVVLYEMLTEQLPVGRFDGPSRWSPVSKGVDEALFRALDQDPSRRFAGVEEFRRAILT